MLTNMLVRPVVVLLEIGTTQDYVRPARRKRNAWLDKTTPHLLALFLPTSINTNVRPAMLDLLLWPVFVRPPLDVPPDSPNPIVRPDRTTQLKPAKTLVMVWVLCTSLARLASLAFTLISTKSVRLVKHSLIVLLIPLPRPVLPPLLLQPSFVKHVPLNIILMSTESVKLASYKLIVQPHPRRSFAQPVRVHPPSIVNNVSTITDPTLTEFAHLVQRKPIAPPMLHLVMLVLDRTLTSTNARLAITELPPMVPEFVKIVHPKPIAQLITPMLLVLDLAVTSTRVRLA